MIHQIWRLSEGGENNLGLACTSEGLVLGRTPLIERQDGRFAVRDQAEIERLLRKAYGAEIVADRLIPGLTTIAAALNANDQGLARIAAVHLRLPDLPDAAVCDRVEAEDRLIKYARDESGSSTDWNPVLHPRTGTPPNPGWFAPTDGAGSESFPVRTAENDDPTRRSDAGTGVRLDRAVLPPGERDDETADLLEWIANANPKDGSAIRAEVKRRYYDIGDVSTGDALNAALSNILVPGVQRKDRQKTLEEIGPYSLWKEDDQRAEFWIGLGLLASEIIAPEVGIAAGVSEEASAAVWKLPPWVRGKFLDGFFRKNTLHPLSRTIDDFIDGNAISYKSLNEEAATYQDFNRLVSALEKDLNELEGYLKEPDAQINWGGDRINASEVTARTLQVATQGRLKPIQRAALSSARMKALSKGIKLIFIEY